MTPVPPGHDAPGVRPQGAPRSCALTWLPIAQLRTSFAALRRGRVGLLAGQTLASQALRVARLNGSYEVVDGFKALERWRDEGATHVPALVEEAHDVTSAKRLVLRANAPRRTLSILDEARVVASLRHDDGLGPKTIARSLERKPDWVRRRMTLTRGLSAEVERKIDAGKIGPSLAEALVTLSSDDQDALVAARDRHRLRGSEALVLVRALREASDPEARRRLLADPCRLLQPSSSAVLSSAAAQIEERLRRAQAALTELAALSLEDPSLSGGERRRLGALRRALDPQIQALAGRPTGSAAPGSFSLPRLETDRDRLEWPSPDHAGDAAGVAARHVPAAPPDPRPLPEPRPPVDLARGGPARGGPAACSASRVPAAPGGPAPAAQRLEPRGASSSAGAEAARPEHARDREPARAESQGGAADPRAGGHAQDPAAQRSGAEARRLPRRGRGARGEGPDHDADPARAA